MTICKVLACKQNSSDSDAIGAFPGANPQNIHYPIYNMYLQTYVIQRLKDKALSDDLRLSCIHSTRRDRRDLMLEMIIFHFIFILFYIFILD